jgi:hypothetical protein
VRPGSILNITEAFGRSQIDPPITLSTTLSLPDIASNLRARERDWRDSAVPTELREIGVRKLVVTENGDELSIHWAGRQNPVNNPACWITVVGRPDGGSEVKGRFGRGKLQILPLIMLLLTPLQAIGRENSPLRWYFVAASVAISVAFFITGRSNTPLLKSHLLQIVEEAVRGSYKPPTSNFGRMLATNDP